jgi:hypothetical protein
MRHFAFTLDRWAFRKAPLNRSFHEPTARYILPRDRLAERHHHSAAILIGAEAHLPAAGRSHPVRPRCTDTHCLQAVLFGTAC